MDDIHKKYRFQRTLNRRLTMIGVENKAEDRVRQVCTHHSTRVSGVCYLLRGGLLPMIISTIADWHNDMINRYGRKMMLDPQLAEAIQFYNPRSMKACYGAIGNGIGADAPKKS